MGIFPESNLVVVLGIAIGVLAVLAVVVVVVTVVFISLVTFAFSALVHGLIHVIDLVLTILVAEVMPHILCGELSPILHDV